MYFISEVSSNHSQDLDRCIDFIKTSAEIGCDAVKFQLFEVEKLFSSEVFKSNPSVLERRNWEIPREYFDPIREACNKYNIHLGCTPFDIEAVEFLKDYVDFFKIASYELLWTDLIIECAKTNKDLIISTGMSNIEEVMNTKNALDKISFDKYSFLHCVSAYPTPANEANLSAIATLKKELNCKVGWSDHTVNQGVIYRAINRWGAEIIEFHLDLDGYGEEYSSGHCWLPNDMKLIIDGINYGQESDGNGIKEPQNSEISDRDWRADPSDGLRPRKSHRSKL